MPQLVDPLLGSSVLGRYRVVRKLARGGMGAVYLARTEGAEGFARPVVIKRVLPTLMGDREVAQMFVREARILSNLQHPGIVGVIDFGQQDDGAYVMVLEYVHGYQLAQWHQLVQRERGPLPIDFALHIAIRVLDALHYAHAFKRADGTLLSIVHRDISPSNVLLSEQGDVKLLDFGIARVSGDESEFQTERPRIKGKLPYVPLEVFRGAEASVRGDVYSTAVVLYELLTGNNPFSGRATADIFHKVLTVVPPSVHASRDDAPERIDQVLLRAMSKDPEQRHATAAELAAELRPLRSEPEDVIAAHLSDQVQADFAGPLPRLFSMEPLSVREMAWRNPESAPAFDLDFSIDVADADHELESSPEAHEARTVQRSLQPEMLAAAVASNPPTLDRTPTSPAPAPEKSAAAATTAAPTPGRSLLPWLTAGLAVGLLALAATYMGVDRGQERIVVISRESTPATTQAPSTAPPPHKKPPNAPPAEPAAPAEPREPGPDLPAAEAATAPATASALAPRSPTAPNPRQLTRAFSRRQAKIEACFATHAAALEGSPQLSVHFVVNPQGKVTEAALEPAALTGTPLGRCLLDAARGTSFGPQPEEVSFHIPITAERMR